MLPQTFLLLAAEVQVEDLVLLGTLVLEAMVGLMVAQVVVAVRALITSETLAQAAMEQTASLWSQPTSNYEIRYCRRPHKSCAEYHPLGWRCPLHTSRWNQLGKCH